nr:SDR family oxidoreductase [Neorhizobium galegae]
MASVTGTGSAHPVKRVIVLGGYGGFGARLSRRLSSDGWTVFVAGRNGEAARLLASQLPNALPLVADRNEDLSSLLAAHRPDLVIDAAGPFQGSGYHVASACIAHGIHYVDLADARDFVCGIAALDAEARKAGVAVISGGSSVPALSGAVINLLARDMDEVRSVNISISTSNRATAGASVAAAILSYAGKPVRLWSGGRWRSGTGLHMLRRERYRVQGLVPIHRLVALADVPDHEIVPNAVKGKPATLFRAGPEFGFQLMALWLVSWTVKRGWLPSMSLLAKWLLPLQKISAGLGTDRSAMAIELKGMAQGTAIIRRWTLIAENGDGPEIPTIAAQLFARAIAEGGWEPGARHSAGLLSLAQFEPLFGGLSISHDIETGPYVPLYRRIMGPAYEALPGSLRAMHDVVGASGAAGSAMVRRGKSWPARVVGAIMRFPPEGEHDLHVAFEEELGVERWTRDFGGHVFSSKFHRSNRFLVEGFGPMRFFFDLPSDACGLSMVMRKWSVFSIRLPLWLAPRSLATEWAEGDDFCFDVPISLPLIGELVHYRGRLRPL